MTDTIKPKRKLSPRGSKAKGDAYERELAAYLDTRLADGRGRIVRAPLSGGGRTFQGHGEADLHGTPGIHVEAKRTERLDVHGSMAQARGSVLARECPDIPVVISRRSRVETGASVVFLTLDDFIVLYEAFLARRGQLPIR